jgi:hypothetical protein
MSPYIAIIGALPLKRVFLGLVARVSNSRLAAAFVHNLEAT